MVKIVNGPHTSTQERTTDGLTVLDPVSLLLREALEEGQGIHIKQFGTFTFEPVVARNGNSRNVNGSRINLRPCFIPTKELQDKLILGSNKEQLSHYIEGSVYQQGVRVSFLNPVPVATGIFYKSDFVRTALETLFKGALDLIYRGYNVNLEFEGIARITVIDKVLQTTFSSSLASHVKAIEQQYPLKNINGSLSALTPTEVGDNISRVHAIRNTHKDSKLKKLERPDSTMLKDIKQRIEKLSTSSKDLCNIHAH